MGEKKKTGGGGHQALYRKYRSKSLDEIIGQEHITKTLKNALKQGKISHAYLFTGPRGTGKTSIARILAHEINNLPYEDEKPHLDIIEIDAASNRRIDDVRDLRDKVHIAPVAAKYKVYIIDEVHMLTSESFNALLKTLEEPPRHVVFILATTEVHKLPATIISRTQRHSFRLIPAEKVIGHLSHIAKQESIKIDKAALELIAEHGGGSFRDSISLLDQISAGSEPISSELVELLLGLAPKETLKKLLTAAQGGNAAQVINSVESLLEGGLTPGGIAGQLLSLLREDAKNGSANASTVELMEKLLSVHNAQYPQLKLETVLLSFAPQEKVAESKGRGTEGMQQPSEEQKADSDTKLQDSKLEAQEANRQPSTTNHSNPKQETPKQPKSTAKPADITIESRWPDILEITKQKNNPLYTVLRLATPEVDDEGLLLIFSFPFHQKKVEEAKHKAVIAEILEQVLGAPIAVRTVVDKTKAKPAHSLASNGSASAPDPAHASLISTVQDIMGGGEVVSV